MRLTEYFNSVNFNEDSKKLRRKMILCWQSYKGMRPSSSRKYLIKKCFSCLRAAFYDVGHVTPLSAQTFIYILWFFIVHAVSNSGVRFSLRTALALFAVDLLRGGGYLCVRERNYLNARFTAFYLNGSFMSRNVYANCFYRTLVLAYFLEFLFSFIFLIFWIDFIILILM